MLYSTKFIRLCIEFKIIDNMKSEVIAQTEQRAKEKMEKMEKMDEEDENI
mgnify:CR=1 FL=1